MDTAATLWPIVVFAIKLMFVGATALSIAVSLWLLEHTLRQGVVPQTKSGFIYTRAKNPLRFWLYIGWHMAFAAAGAVMIHVFIHFGAPPEQPATNKFEEQAPPPARPNDESYDRADVEASRQKTIGCG